MKHDQTDPLAKLAEIPGDVGRQSAKMTSEPSGWSFEYQHPNGQWIRMASAERPLESPQRRDIEPLYRHPHTPAPTADLARDYQLLVDLMKDDDRFATCDICGAWLTAEENSHGADINACWARAVEGGDEATCRSYRNPHPLGPTAYLAKLTEFSPAGSAELNLGAAEAACRAWRAEKPRHFMNEAARQKWARVADAVITAHEAQKDGRE